MAGDNSADPKLAELTALLEEVRARVRERHLQTTASHLALPDLLPLLHARDAAYGKIAAIGSVNPRRGGPVNALIQTAKRLLARSLHWLVRDQIEFNRASVTATEAVLAALQENNRALNELSAGAARLDAALRDTVDPLQRDFHDIRAHWIAWRSEWARKLELNEIQFLRGLADLQTAFTHRATLMESNYRDLLRAQHTDFEGALARGAAEIQQRLWADLETARAGFQTLVHEELRVLRQKAWMYSPAAQPPRTAGAQPDFPSLDWWRFADKFRGPEAYVRQNHEFYLPYFRDCRAVADLGCGRGEFLSLLKDNGISARGVELSPELVAFCRTRGLEAEEADLFAWLLGQPQRSLDGIFCSQVVEHLPPARVWELVRLAQAKLAPGGVLAIETPNPESLAIFASHYFLDPTHTRPVPPALLEFYFEENGFGDLVTRRFAPAVDSMPELASLDPAFRDRFFGTLDYAVIGRQRAK